jgi:hypothetical protein
MGAFQLSATKNVAFDPNLAASQFPQSDTTGTQQCPIPDDAIVGNAIAYSHLKAPIWLRRIEIVITAIDWLIKQKATIDLMAQVTTLGASAPGAYSAGKNILTGGAKTGSILQGQPPLVDPNYSGPPVNPNDAPSWMPSRSYGTVPSRAISGEANAAYNQYPIQKGWRLFDGPGAHRWNAGGPDIVAFRFNESGGIDVEIVDNKSFADANVSSVSALDKNLEQNLKGLIQQTYEPQYADMPGLSEVRSTFQQALNNLQTGAAMPPNLKLVVTNWGGNASQFGSGVGSSLPPGWNIDFRNIMPR